MKRLSIYLFFILLSLHIPSLADDIRDFQIEGMSVGDSLLDYFSEEKIEKEKNTEYVFRYKDNRFVNLGVGYGSAFPLSQKLEIYDEVGVTIKPNDKSYKIYSVTGDFYCEKDINICFSKKEEILSELKDFFGNQAELYTYKKEHRIDTTGNSIVYGNRFSFKQTRDIVSLNIYKWGNEILTEKNWAHSVKLNISLEEFDNFIRNEAYE